MNIRAMAITDIEMVSQLDETSSWNASKIQDCLRQSQYQCWVMDVNKQLIGYAISQTILDEAHVLNIAIDVDYRSQGYGRQLLQHILNVLPAERAILEVRSDNIVAKALYNKLGFEKIGERKGYYQIDGISCDAEVFSRGHSEENCPLSGNAG
tara:strand:- start:5154 stop:5612 length:459 start_codon:yes stop_codon:yes gene_type:complete